MYGRNGHLSNSHINHKIMRKYIWILIFSIFAITEIQAQNTNRSGIIAELCVGTPLNLENITTIGTDDYQIHRLLFDISVGYRFATSRHWAVDIKLNALTDMCGIDSSRSLLAISLIPGLRYTSVEFHKNISFYTSLNAGFGIRINQNIIDNKYPSYMCGYWELGLNLNEKIYIGTFINDIWLSRLETEPNITIDEDYVLYIGDYCNIFLLGLKFGYRF